MSTAFELTAESRNDMGKGASRRLRRDGRVPGILYGGDGEPKKLSLRHNELLRRLEDEAFYSSILTVNVDGKAEQAVLRDLQRHPAKPMILHVDLQRVKVGELLRMHVPLHVVGGDIAPGVKTGGGFVIHAMNEVEVECLPKDLPEAIAVDVSAMQLGESLHLSDLILPDGVVLPELHRGEGHDLPVVHLEPPRVVEAEETAAPEAPEGDEPPAS